jgi:ABC-type methionine transport system ATPase subunit
MSNHSSPSQQAQIRLKVQIPPRYHQEPIISRLALQTAIEVNILGGILTPNSRESGWFDLQLQGTRLQLDYALDYLNNLGITIWDSSSVQNLSAVQSKSET